MKAFWEKSLFIVHRSYPQDDATHPSVCLFTRYAECVSFIVIYLSSDKDIYIHIYRYPELATTHLMITHRRFASALATISAICSPMLSLSTLSMLPRAPSCSLVLPRAPSCSLVLPRAPSCSLVLPRAPSCSLPARSRCFFSAILSDG